MKVWRVEHGIDRYGPYCSSPLTGQRKFTEERVEFARKISDYHSGPSRYESHPSTGRDGYWDQWWFSEHRHGLNRFRHLKEWFAGFTEPLRENGFVVSVYEVPAGCYWIGNSGRQVFFDPNHATLIRTRAIWRE